MTMTEMRDLESAYQHCAEVTRRAARNFYYGLKLLPQQKRAALYGIYAWMRLVDDIADDTTRNPESAREQLEGVRSRTHAALHGDLPDVPEHRDLWIVLSDTASRFPIVTVPFDRMIDGQLEDLSHVGYETFDDLRAYCHRVASTVGLICIDIWGYDDPQARCLAADQGVAFQLTNILRDFRVDFASDRVYLPREDFAAAGLTPKELLAWEDDDRCSAFVQMQAARAESFYTSSAPLVDLIHEDCRATLAAMVGIYHGLLGRILARPRLIIAEQPARLNTLSKINIALRARLGMQKSSATA